MRSHTILRLDERLQYDEYSGDIQFWAQTHSGSSPDFDPGPPSVVSLVGNVPLTPTVASVEDGNEALNVTWSWPVGAVVATDTSLRGVQLFCQRGADNQVCNAGTFGAAYMAASMVCPTTVPPTTVGSLTSLDPSYLCSGLIAPTATSYRIAGLQNGIPYGVGVAAVDKHGNISAISNIVYATLGTGAGGAQDAGGAGSSVDGSATSVGGEGVDASGSEGKAATDTQVDGGAGTFDAGTSVAPANGCSCDIRGKRDRSETAAILWLGLAALAFVGLRDVYRPVKRTIKAR
jgi:hypothetical protein